MTIVLFSAYRSFPAEVQGLGHHSLGMLSLTASGLLFCAGPLMPEALLLFVANSTMLGGAGMMLIGTQLFYGRRPSWWWLALAWAAGMVCLVGWYVITQDYALRVAVFSLLTLSFYVAQLVLLVRHGERHFSSWFFGALLLVQSLVLLLRLFAALSGAVGTSNAKLLAALERQTGAVEEQTAAVVSVTLKAADSNADKVNKGTINAGQMRNYKLNLDAEAVAQ